MSFVVMVAAATFLVVAVFLYFPVLTFAIQPKQKSERLPSFSSISGDDPEPPRSLGAENAVKLRRMLASVCRKSVRSESDTRKLEFPSGRIAKLCDCNAEVTVAAVDNNWRPGGDFEDFRLIVGDMHSERREWDNARYLATVTGLERACAARSTDR